MSYPYQQPVYPASYPIYQNPYQQMQQAIMPSIPQSLQQQQTTPQTISQTIPQINTQQPIQATMQNGGFAFVKNEQEARDYPVAPGNYMTFKDEHAPYMYEKSKSFSQLEEPTFEKYRLIREDSGSQPSQEAHTAVNEPKPDGSAIEALRADYAAMSGELDELKKEIESLRRQMREPDRKANRRKEDLTHE